MSFKFELHCHTAETSYCASCKAEDSVAMLKSGGYDGVAITNHYYGDWFATRKEEKTWEEKINAWLTSYRLAKETGDKIGLSVILGAEFGFDYFPANHFLCYGMDEEFFFEYPELYKYTPEDFFKLANKKGFFFCQAHPQRAQKPENPKFLHGMEFYNTHGNNRDEITYETIKQNNLVGTVGSDFHHKNQFGKTAVLLSELATDSKELAKLLHKNKIDGYIIKSEDITKIPEVFHKDKRFKLETL